MIKSERIFTMEWFSTISLYQWAVLGDEAISKLLDTSPVDEPIT